MISVDSDTRGSMLKGNMQHEEGRNVRDATQIPPLNPTDLALFLASWVFEGLRELCVLVLEQQRSSSIPFHCSLPGTEAQSRALGGA